MLLCPKIRKSNLKNKDLVKAILKNQIDKK